MPTFAGGAQQARPAAGPGLLQRRNRGEVGARCTDSPAGIASSPTEHTREMVACRATCARGARRGSRTTRRHSRSSARSRYRACDSPCRRSVKRSWSPGSGSSVCSPCSCCAPHGCRVLGIDPDPARRGAGAQFGAEAVALDRGRGSGRRPRGFSRRPRRRWRADHRGDQAATSRCARRAQMCRQRGRIVLVGVAGLELNRADFYQKELTFQVSCSYGPGRHDPQYEEQGHGLSLRSSCAGPSSATSKPSWT